MATADNIRDRSRYSQTDTDLVNQAIHSGSNFKLNDKMQISETADDEAASLSQLQLQDYSYSFVFSNPVELAQIEPGETIIDLGFSDGLDLVLSAYQTGQDGIVIGIAQDDDVLDVAHQQVNNTELTNVLLKKAALGDLPLTSNSVDKVVSNCAVSMASEKPAIISEIHRVLKSGGMLSISDIVIGNIPAWALDQAKHYADCVSNAVTLDDYLSIIKNAGFSSIKVCGFKTYSEVDILSVLDLENTQIRKGVREGYYQQIMDVLDGNIHSVHLLAYK